MKLYSILALSFLLCNFESLSQSITFSVKDTAVTIDTSKDVQFDVEAKVLKEANIEVEIDINSGSTAIEGKDYAFKRVVLSITEKTDDQIVYNVPITILKTATPDRKISLSMIDRATGRTIAILYISLRAKKGDTPEFNPYKLSIGTNFDFLDGLEAQNLYTELNIFLPGILADSWGVMLGAYRNRSISKDSTINPRVFLSSSRFPNQDTIAVIRDSVMSKGQITINNLGLYLAPNFRIFDSENLDLFATFHAEVIQRKFTLERTNTIVGSDTVYYPQQYAPRVVGQKTSPTEFSFTKVNEVYFGVGVPFHYITKDIEIFVRPMVGIARVHQQWGSSYYNFQFNIIALESGLNLGGEVRGLLPAYAPYINIYFAKVFNIKDFGNFLFGKLSKPTS